jgi:acylphosphatase
MLYTVHVMISGRVQGVFFRVHTKKQADKLDVKGWVRNMDDGRVEAMFEGEKDKVDSIVSWCHVGPTLSKVTQVIVTPINVPVGCEGFFIKN